MKKTTKITQCQLCQKEMALPFWLSKRRKTCSKRCMGLLKRKVYYLKNKSECLNCKETFRKGSASKGRFCSTQCYWKSQLGKPSNSSGKKRPLSSGENHWNWKGGSTPEQIRVRMSVEYRLWREAVFARDNWSCQECSERGGKLHAHHKKQFAFFPELRFAIDNGVTLCKECHKKTDSYGSNGRTRKVLVEVNKYNVDII